VNAGAAPVYTIELMSEIDIPAVSKLEKRCFSNPWPQSAYRRELRNAERNYYVVLRESGPESRLAEARAYTRSEFIERQSRLTSLARALRTTRSGGQNGDGSIIGFAGFWHLFDEAHITTIAVDPDRRGRSLGELLLVALIEEAVNRGTGYLSLEVRVSNLVAVSLYEKYGFRTRGVRPNYYVDDGEDAFVMWSEDIRSAEFRAMLDDRRDDLQQSLGSSAILPSSSGRVTPS
jgi:[ribosomal protein S18]-alanine N-acetyltransferase